MAGGIKSTNFQLWSQYVEGEMDFEKNSIFKNERDDFNLKIDCFYQRFSELQAYSSRLTQSYNEVEQTNKFSDAATQVLLSVCSDPAISCYQVAILLILKADPNYHCPKTGLTPMHFLANVGKFKSLNCMQHFGADVNSYDRNGKTPLIIACKEETNTRNNSKSVKILANWPNSLIDHKDHSGYTALDYAIANQNVWNVRTLLKAGAHPPVTHSYYRPLSTEPKISTRVTFQDTLSGDEEKEDEIYPEEEKEDFENDDIDHYRKHSPAMTSTISAIGITSAAPSDSTLPKDAIENDYLQHRAAALTTRKQNQPQKQSYAQELEQRLRNSTDYRYSSTWIHILLQSYAKEELCRRLVDFRRIEVERRDLKAKSAPPPLIIPNSTSSSSGSINHKTSNSDMRIDSNRNHHENHERTLHSKASNNSKNNQEEEIAERSASRLQRKAAKSTQLKNSRNAQEEQERLRWELKRQQIQFQVDAQYSSTANLKGMFS